MRSDVLTAFQSKGFRAEKSEIPDASAFDDRQKMLALSHGTGLE